MTTLIVAAAISLGLTAGALLAEALVLVPFWQTLQAQAFLVWYRDNGGLLLRFFGPLEVGSTALVLLATAAAWLGESAGFSLLIASSVLTLLVLAAFPVYFQRANTSFANGTIELDHVAEELKRWARWHWARVAIASAAFVLAVLAVLETGAAPLG